MRDWLQRLDSLEPLLPRFMDGENGDSMRQTVNYSDRISASRILICKTIPKTFTVCGFGQLDRNVSIVSITLLSPERRRCAVSHACQTHGMSERFACRVVNQLRGTQRHQPIQRKGKGRLTRAIITLASQYERYGYCRITALLQQSGCESARIGSIESGVAKG